MSKPLVAITGASSGIGEETARAFSREGHPLLLMARRLDRLEALGLADCLCEKVDVTDLASMRQAIRKGEERFGPVDCLVNNAGVMLLSRAHLQDVKEWERMLDVNVKGMLNGIHLVLQSMIERRAGTIISVASVAGIKPGPNLAIYSGAKFAVRAISESIREEAAPHNVRVSVVSPGLVETELLEHTTVPELKEAFQALKEPMGGFLDPADVARAILYVYRQPAGVCVREVVLSATRQLR
ncbi:MAG: SDR family oxidoreductase [bacterium]|nr:MAG: SDR family oxidoreductase [bacterium]